ncbi:MAG: hypothetical protein ICV69_11930 [Thermoleophilaceae bacterium]|nr:hypothetical protein [Thermoleophilaceae bacterium]
MTGFVKDALGKRVQGDRPSVVRALVVALMVGVGAAVATYKLMRTQG